MIQVISEELKALYTEYGIACVQLEIAQGKLNEVKQRLVAEINKRPEPVEKKAE